MKTQGDLPCPVPGREGTRNARRTGAGGAAAAQTEVVCPPPRAISSGLGFHCNSQVGVPQAGRRPPCLTACDLMLGALGRAAGRASAGAADARVGAPEWGPPAPRGSVPRVRRRGRMSQGPCNSRRGLRHGSPEAPSWFESDNTSPTSLLQPAHGSPGSAASRGGRTSFSAWRMDTRFPAGPGSSGERRVRRVRRGAKPGGLWRADHNQQLDFKTIHQASLWLLASLSPSAGDLRGSHAQGQGGVSATELSPDPSWPPPAEDKGGGETKGKGRERTLEKSWTPPAET